MHEIEVYRPLKGPLGSPWRLALAALFAAVGVWMLFEPRDWRDVLVALLCMVWFGWAAVQRAHRWVLERSFVRLEPEGIAIGNPLRTRFYAWSDVEQFTFIGIPGSLRTGTEGQVRVGIRLKPTHPESTDRHPDGIDVLLPPDLQDVSPKELAWRLNERRMAAAGETLAV